MMSLQIPANPVPEPERLGNEKPVETIHTKVNNNPAANPNSNPTPLP